MARAGQPGERDVVEHLIAREIVHRLSVDEGSDDLVVAAGVVVEHPRCQRDRRVRKPIQGLWAQSHLQRVTDTLCEQEAQPIAGTILVG
jgi:hypothetical protein